MSHFVEIGVLGRQDSETTEYSLKRLIRYLQVQKVNVYVEESSASMVDSLNTPVLTIEQMASTCDLIIVVGGDGSLLSAARAFSGFKPKILGINRGRLGFLTDISPNEIEYKVGEVLEGKYKTEKRALLCASLVRDGELIYENLALNDVVIHPGKFIRMIEFELYIDGDFVYRQRSDGLIISTPTGSTAYALSGGGPIMHPQLDAMVLVPMNPHMLSSRPIVVDGQSEIKIVISDANEIYPQVSCDGQHIIPIAPGDSVTITKKPFKIRLIHPTTHNFYETSREKLGWANSVLDS